MTTLTIAGHEVKLNRRRYGTKTYTWALVKPDDSREFIEIEGDPWTAITPKRTELEEAVKNHLHLHYSRYFQLRDACSPLVKHFRDDLFLHDQEAILFKPPRTPYMHWARDTGTHMIMLTPHDHESWPVAGEVAPYLFGHANREQILEQVPDFAMACEKSDLTLVRHYFDGQKLRRMQPDEMTEIAERYVEDIRRRWKTPMALV